MTPNEYQALAMRTNDGKHSLRLMEFVNSYIPNGVDNEQCLDNDDLILGVMGLCGEAGEVIDLVKKMIFHGHTVDREEIKKELGDVLWYIAMLCQAFNFDLEDVMRTNIDKLKKRYPNGFSKQDSINRQE